MFPHLVIRDLVTADEITAINAEWPADGWTEKDGKTSIKSYIEKPTGTAARVIERLTSQAFRDHLGGYFGIPDLLPDPSGFGGGLHRIKRGGFLKMHVDFNRHPSGLWRRVNLLLYLNQDWRAEWGGALMLGEPFGSLMGRPIFTTDDERPVEIVPCAGVAVAFPTTETSWHGHPYPLKCPPDRERRSIAVYYYTKEAPPDAAEPHTTIYREPAA